jgi:hypothetical protein
MARNKKLNRASKSNKNSYALTINGLQETFAAFQAVPLDVQARGLEIAVKRSMAPEVAAVKMTIAKELAGAMVKKGIADYKRSIGIKSKLYTRTGSAWAGVGAKSRYKVDSSHKRKKRNYTIWAYISHLFEFGTKQGIPAYNVIEKTQMSDNAKIQAIFAREIRSAIYAAIRRNAKVKAIKAKA